MSEFSFDSQLRPIYEQKEELTKKGIIFDFSKIDGDAFAFDSDTTDLLMMLEMGLSLYHITLEGKELRSDFGAFCDVALIKVIDEYRLSHPNRK